MVARHYRLREDADVRRVRARGKAWPQGPLVARVLPNTLEPPQNRYTVIAGKRCGKSVQRNRLKRLVREALRGYHPHLKAGHDIAVICRGTVDDLPHLIDAQTALHRIFTRASLFVADPDGGAPPAPGDPVRTGWSARAAGTRAEPSSPVLDSGNDAGGPSDAST
jgi:ribonuclease P protein component